ncbi:type IV pilus biogenesis/stability protein PilW [Vibrio hannami]|uniref:type IV pilus biogenesis/stability protein PilW n=1 Tax=Vibrio hannami TaxID=2717094 RepID=UPI00240FB928|nr:type IV pilus biogenesis/stability protein PilW [Vibrio hannami]MDG3087237.1 type IV pilus biogenesis/stability protein PilW [Vibrio hannami]
MATFVACLLVGCVTVNEQDIDSNFDKLQAARARIALGLSYLDAGNMVKARENLELAVQYAPDYYRSLNSIAYFYQRVGEFELAERAYKKALRKSPENGDLFNNYGAFLCKRGEYEKADEYFNRAIEQPHYYLVSDSYENAAVCALKGGNRKKAKYYFGRSLENEPYRRISSLKLSELEIEDGELDLARKRLLRFQHKFGYQPANLALLIELEQQAGNNHLTEEYKNTFDSMYPGLKQN